MIILSYLSSLLFPLSSLLSLGDGERCGQSKEEKVWECQERRSGFSCIGMHALAHEKVRESEKKKKGWKTSFILSSLHVHTHASAHGEREDKE